MSISPVVGSWSRRVYPAIHHFISALRKSDRSHFPDLINSFPSLPIWQLRILEISTQSSPHYSKRLSSPKIPLLDECTRYFSPEPITQATPAKSRGSKCESAHGLAFDWLHYKSEGSQETFRALVSLIESSLSHPLTFPVFRPHHLCHFPQGSGITFKSMTGSKLAFQRR